jgi:RHS repeat-associated protein
MDQRDATGLSYRRNRYYDPGSGQFTQADPIGIAGGLNLYGYANGDPVNFSDPFGLQACPDDEGETDEDCVVELAPPLVTPGSAVAGAAKVVGAIAGGIRAARIISQTRTILGAGEFGAIRAAAQAGTAAEVQIAGRTIMYEPGLAASGMTLEGGFVLGRQAFGSSAELAKTILHELYRGATSTARWTGLGGAGAAAETGAAYSFADRAYRVGRFFGIF